MCCSDVRFFKPVHLKSAHEKARQTASDNWTKLSFALILSTQGFWNTYFWNCFVVLSLTVQINLPLKIIGWPFLCQWANVEKKSAGDQIIVFPPLYIFSSHLVFIPFKGSIVLVIFFPNTELGCGVLQGVWGRITMPAQHHDVYQPSAMASSISPTLVKTFILLQKILISK